VTEATRPTWNAPRLVVLTHGTPEESVLAACKGGRPSGAQSTFGACYKEKVPKCMGCSGVQHS
jgi:hypothetical protein